jgi:endonuclease/exonuclease/phosphatase family metal-dependent hydrolase
VHASAAGRPARTFPARVPWLRLDRIYVRNVRHRPVQVSAREWRMLSDHLPLAAELGMGARSALSNLSNVEFQPAS